MHTIEEGLAAARSCYQAGNEIAAKAEYLAILKLDPCEPRALSELGALALASGHRSAARTAYTQAVKCHPDSAAALVELGNLELLENFPAAARQHFEAALDLEGSLAEAHQGLARALSMLGQVAAAEPHFRRGFSDRALVPMPYRGQREAVRVLLLLSVRFGNVDTREFLDDRIFEVLVLYAEYFDLGRPLPAHSVIFNAIGDADLCQEALRAAQRVVALSYAPVINAPEQVLKSGRAENSRRLAKIAGLMSAQTRSVHRSELPTLEAEPGIQFPMLLRSPGFHMGLHFVRVDAPEALLTAAAALPGAELLLMPYLDARAADGMSRKYRVMIIDGVLYPLHLAVSKDWKVHYFSAAMDADPAYRAEEQQFLSNMSTVVGSAGIEVLRQIGAELALDYAGVDFGLHPDGTVLLFEANATMVIAPPPADPMWDYRRDAIEAARTAAAELVLKRSRGAGGTQVYARTPPGSTD